MDFSLFWDADAQLCVAVCRGAGPTDLALAALDATGRQTLVATDGGRGFGELKLLIGAFPESTREFQIVELAQPQNVLGQISLAALSADEPSVWRTILFAPATGGAPATLAVNPDLSAAEDRTSLQRRFRTELRRRALPIDGAWLLAARLSQSGVPRVKAATLVWPPAPTLSVKALRDVAEAPQNIDAAWPELLKLAYKPLVGEAILEFSADEAGLVGGQGRLTVVAVSQQMRFFQQKDDYLRTVDRPGADPLTLHELLGAGGAGLVNAPKQTLAFEWRPGLDAATHHARPIFVAIDPQGRSARLSYPDGALGDDLYIVAERPILVGPNSDQPESILGFRIRVNGFEPLDLAAPDVIAYAKEAEQDALAARAEETGFGEPDHVDAPRGPTPTDPLAGFLEIAYKTAKSLGLVARFPDFARSPATMLEHLAWSRQPLEALAPDRRPLATTLATAAGLVSELDDVAPLAEQCATLRFLRRSQDVERLRTVRVRLPADAREMETALAVARTLADAAKLEDGEATAEHWGEREIAERLRAFRLREPGDWTSFAEAKRLAAEFPEDDDEDDLAEVGLSSGETRSTMSIERACAAFEAALARAESTTNIDRAQLARLRERYEGHRAARRLNFRRALDKLRGRLEQLTTGPRVGANFAAAVEALEAWAQLPGFWSVATARTDARAAETAEFEWTGLEPRFRPPHHPLDPSGNWGAARERFLGRIAEAWATANGDVRAEEIDTRARALRDYADALMHHRVYVSLNAQLDLAGRGRSARLANALCAWPLEAGVAWRAAEEAFGAEALDAIIAPPALAQPRAA